MFRYNRFWHFWFTLDNRHYVNSIFATILITGSLFFLSTFFIFSSILTIPLGIAAVIASTLLVVATIAVFTKLSDFFYNRQNQVLQTLKDASEDKTYKEQVDLFLNRRTVCPSELLAQKKLDLPDITSDLQTTKPVLLHHTGELTITQNTSNINRNVSYNATMGERKLFIKKSAANNALSEIAAREMAELMGLTNVIPTNSVTKVKAIADGSRVVSDELLPSREAIQKLIDRDNLTREDQRPVTNTHGVQNSVAKALLNFKTAAYRSAAQKAKVENREIPKLLYIQHLVPNAMDGLKVIYNLYGLVRTNNAKDILKMIDLASFQENFLLHILLGSEDANPGNTLFVNGVNNKKKLYSIDNERIMPESNYNVTKQIPMALTGDISKLKESPIENVFPIRLWLAGLPHAEMPFSREVIKKTLDSFDPKRLVAYHHQKKLFSDAAVGAQLERVLLIRRLFEEEYQNPTGTLTPRSLFLTLVNDHPSYDFLKSRVGLSDLTTFLHLGNVSEDADWSILRHPMQTIPLRRLAINTKMRAQQGAALYTDEDADNPYSAKFYFFSLAHEAHEIEQMNPNMAEFLEETARGLRV